MISWFGQVVFEVRSADGKRGGSADRTDLLGEMVKLQELSTYVSDVLREWLDDQILAPVGEQTWTDMSEEWTELMHGTWKNR